jgi:uncharacterized protein YjbJ (UPF0337 family)
MSGVDLATAYVTIVPETRSLPGELARAFQRVGDQRVGIDVDGRGVRRDVERAFARVGDQTVGVDVDASGARRDLSREFERAGRPAGRAGGEAAGGGIADALSGMGSKAGPIGMALGAAFAVAGISAPALFMKALQKGMEREKVLDLTQARLGLDEATTARIGTAAGRAYADTFGASVEENIGIAQQAISAGLIDPTASTQQMQAVISEAAGVTELIDGDLTETVKAASILMKNGLAANAASAFDLIAAGYTRVGPAGDDLIDSLKEYSSGWANAGLTGEQAIALIGQSIDMGVDSTDRGADALREFGRRVTEEGDTIIEALDNIGLNGQEMYEAFKKGGPEAFDAFDKAFDKIRAIEDPAERNAAAMALLGDTAGDFIGTFAQWDPSEAVAKFSEVEGATTNALDAMTGNAATSVESAKRNIELSFDQLSDALAHAFGPKLEQLGDWVAGHQPEILGFLGDLVDAAFVTGDAVLVFASTWLNAFADVTEATGAMLQAMIGPIGMITQAFGKLTGDEGMEALGDAMANVHDKFGGIADGARALADGIDNKARPALDNMRDSITGDITEAQRASEMMRALGEDVTAIPTEHGIVLSDNSPEVTARLQDLGLKVETLPDGQVVVRADTSDGQRTLDAFLANNYGKEIPVDVKLRAAEDALDVWTRRRLGLDGGFADGGLLHGPGTGRSDSMLIAASNGEFITNAAATRRNLPLLEAINNGWVPPAGFLHAMVPGFADGGLASNRALSWARSHNGDPYVYGGLDCSGFLSGVYGQLTNTASRFTTDSDFSAWGFQPGYDPNGFNIGTDGGSGTNGHMAGDLLGVHIESDGTNGIQFGGSAQGALDFPNVWHLPRDLWAPPETDDPSTATAPGGLGSGLGGSAAGGSGTSGSTGGLGGAGSSSGGSYGGQNIPAGVTPVWVVNLGGVTSLEPTPPEDVVSAPPSTTTSTGTGDNDTDHVGNALRANGEQLFSDLGIRTSGGAIQALVEAIRDGMAAELAKALQQQQAQTRTFLATRR